MSMSGLQPITLLPETVHSNPWRRGRGRRRGEGRRRRGGRKGRGEEGEGREIINVQFSVKVYARTAGKDYIVSKSKGQSSLSYV